MKESGILMPLSSLPSGSGIGEMGAETLEFIEQLKKAGVKIWQILPLNPAGFGNSPYQPYSSCAGDEAYISLEKLFMQGLIKNRPEKYRETEKSVDFDGVRAWKEPYLREAFGNFQETEEYRSFAEQSWVYEYGIFRAMKKKNQNRCWNEWSEEEKSWPETRQQVPDSIEEEARYQMFLQYVFFCQWMEIKKAANGSGIRIMGDVPFYVGIDSADVWAGRKNFLLDQDGRPILIAGVPPDYFSATGQRWGNPIYDWEYLKKNRYQFWVDRIGYSSRLFDMIRIDHFRAFDTFWKIPASCPTAIDGQWVEAPGYEVLDILTSALPEVELVAEDLGDLRSEVLTLKEHYHLKGMKVLEFVMDTSGKYARDTFPDSENMIIYTGTHDNSTLMEWYWSMSTASRRKLRRFLSRQGIRNGSVKERLLEYVWRSRAKYAIIPMADILGLGKDARINTPGTVGSPNWQWRLPDMDRIGKGLSRYTDQMRERK